MFFLPKSIFDIDSRLGMCILRLELTKIWRGWGVPWPDSPVLGCYRQRTLTSEDRHRSLAELQIVYITVQVVICTIIVGSDSYRDHTHIHVHVHPH